MDLYKLRVFRWCYIFVGQDLILHFYDEESGGATIGDLKYPADVQVLAKKILQEMAWGPESDFVWAAEGRSSEEGAESESETDEDSE